MKKKTEKKYNEYDPERDILGRAGGDYGHRLADTLIFEKEVETLEKENELEKMTLFVKKADELNLNPDKQFNDRFDKEKLIRELNGNKNYFSTFSDYRIGNIFHDIYYSSKKKLSKLNK
jgi:soluble P-type ATPase